MSVTAETSHEPIGPSEQDSGSLMHLSTPFLSSLWDLGAKLAVTGARIKGCALGEGRREGEDIIYSGGRGACGSGGNLAARSEDNGGVQRESERASI